MSNKKPYLYTNKKEMRHIKIVDTIATFGNAEKHIMFKSDFEKFLNREFGLTRIKHLDPLSIVKKYNLKGIVFGNYVTQEERYFFLYKIEKQLELLASLKGNNNLGKGILIIAFGSQGVARAKAHYDPSQQLINLNRGRKSKYTDILKGESSFIHEYGHFIDFTTGTNDKGIGEHFPSKLALEPSGNKKSVYIAKTLQPILEDKDYMNGIKYSPYLSSNIEIFARLFETAITHYAYNSNHRLRNYLDRGYTEYYYYPEMKIIQHGLDKRCLQILKNF